MSSRGSIIKPYRTSPDPAFDRLVRATPIASMAHWAGTGPEGTTCGQCKHFGYDAPVRDRAGNTMKAVRKPTSCRLYWVLMRKHGNPLPPTTDSCKHFTVREG
jgi:hypothetical protein